MTMCGMTGIAVAHSTKMPMRLLSGLSTIWPSAGAPEVARSRMAVGAPCCMLSAIAVPTTTKSISAPWTMSVQVTATMPPTET